MSRKNERFIVIARPYLILLIGLLISSVFIMFKAGNQMVWYTYLSAGISISAVAGVLYWFSSKIKSESFQPWRIFLSAWIATILWNGYMMLANEMQIGDYLAVERGLVMLFDLAFQTPLLFGGVTAAVEWLFEKQKWLVK